MVGIKQSRSIQDEKLIEAIFQSHWSPETRISSGPVYGATPTNLIIDARPTVNAVANTAKGAGTENMEYYKEGRKIYLGIDHIHTMRDSLARVVEALKDADQLLASINNDLNDHISGLVVLDRQALRRSGWLRHITAILEGTLIMVKNIHVNSSHVLVHCSDGWDRTSQLSALVQLCLDPFYRTIRGFEILIEKDWVSFGHKFLDRCGHLSSEKFFLSTTPDQNTGDAAQAFLTSMQNRFASQHHIKETSPIFHQFLESVRQIQRQFPERFEFNERFLRQLYYHLYSCQFGTFLFNSEKERRVGDADGPPACERTVSVWDFFNSPAEMALNRSSLYDPSLDDPSRRTPDADMGVLYPKPKDVRFWHELYGRTDEEMNGRIIIPQARESELMGAIESAYDDPTIQRSITPEVFQSLTTKAPNISRSLSQSHNVPSLSQRSGSPALASSLRDLTSSLPELATRPNPNKSPTPPAIHSVSSTTTPSSASIAAPISPTWSRAKQPELLSGGGMKSMWGKFSSNASAAFSVVQDAYSGVAKDFLNTEPVEREPSPSSEKELRGWSTPSSRIPPMNMGNPWASTSSTTTRRPSFYEGNPWDLSSEPELPHNSADRPPSVARPPSPLPLDPTITTIPLLRQPASDFSSTTTRLHKMRDSRSASPTFHSQTTTKGNTDPLGVGLL